LHGAGTFGSCEIESKIAVVSEDEAVHLQDHAEHLVMECRARWEELISSQNLRGITEWPQPKLGPEVSASPQPFLPILRI
jgi:hypothetical protein